MLLYQQTFVLWGDHDFFSLNNCLCVLNSDWWYKNLIASITMPETKSDCDANSCAEPPDKDGDDASEFVEVDPTGRYGRVGIPTLSLAWIIFSWTVFPESLRVFHALYAYLSQWNMFSQGLLCRDRGFLPIFSRDWFLWFLRQDFFRTWRVIFFPLLCGMVMQYDDVLGKGAFKTVYPCNLSHDRG